MYTGGRSSPFSTGSFYPGSIKAGPFGLIERRHGMSAAQATRNVACLAAQVIYRQKLAVGCTRRLTRAEATSSERR